MHIALCALLSLKRKQKYRINTLLAWTGIGIVCRNIGPICPKWAVLSYKLATDGTLILSLLYLYQWFCGQIFLRKCVFMPSFKSIYLRSGTLPRLPLTVPDFLFSKPFAGASAVAQPVVRSSSRLASLFFCYRLFAALITVRCRRSNCHVCQVHYQSKFKGNLHTDSFFIC